VRRARPLLQPLLRMAAWSGRSSPADVVAGGEAGLDQTIVTPGGGSGGPTVWKNQMR
jgi:hypothetical protein